MRLVAICAALLTTTAFADPNDFLVAQLGNPTTDPTANDNFRIFARELSATLNSVNLMPPETLGAAGFSLNAELSAVDIQSGRFNFPTTRNFDGPLLIPSVHVRKGLPYSFELGGRAAWLDKSRMASGTLEIKWALTEGYTYLPSLGVRAFVTHLFNNRDINLTSGGFDLGLGKQFAIGGVVTLTPYVGWSLVYTAASSNQVDFNRSRTRAESLASATAQLDGTAAFSDVSFAQNRFNRFYGGLRFIAGVFQLGAEVSSSDMGSINAVDPNNPSGPKVSVHLPAVTAYNVTLGLDY